MPVNVIGEGALEWDASINVEGFVNGQKQIETGLQEIANKAIESAKVTADAFLKTNEAQTTLAETAEKNATTVFEAWKKRAEEIVRMAKEAGLKAGESFEFKNPSINGIESTTIITSEQIRQMEIALTMLDDSLDTQQKIQKSGLTELEFLRTKQQLLSEIGLQLDEANSIQIQALEKQQELERDIAREKTGLSDDVVTKRSAPTVDDVLGAEFKGLLKEAGQNFDDLDDRTKGFIQSVVDLELKLSEVAQAQKEVDAAYDQGKLGLQEYTDAVVKLSVQEGTLKKDIAILTENQREYEQSLYIAKGSVEEKENALRSLEATYRQLSEAERSGTEGTQLSSRIAELKNEIKGLEPGKINDVSKNFYTVQTELKRLTELMARTPDSPMFETWKNQAAQLKEQMKNAKESIDQATNSTAGVEAFGGALRGLIGGYTAATGAIGLFVGNSEKADEVTKNATSALALLNGVQEISNILQKNSALNIFLNSLRRKAATTETIAATAATQANTGATAANTAASASQATATTAATTATRSLNAAMLANPAALLVTAIAALTVAYIAFSDNSSVAAMNQKRLADEQNKVNEGLVDQKTKLEPLLEVVRKGNLTQEQQLYLYNEFNKINPSIVEGIDKQALSYDRLSQNANNFLQTFTRQIQLEQKTEQLKKGILAVGELNTDILTAQADNSFFGLSRNFDVSRLTEKRDKQIEINEQINKEIELLQAQGKVSDAVIKGSVADFDRQIKEKRELLEKTTNKADYDKIQKDIKDLEAQKKKITGASKQEIRAAINAEKKEQREYNQLLNEQKNLLQLIDNLKRDSKQSGLVKELSDIDKINEKYDLAIGKIEEFNKKAPKNLQVSVDPLNDARKAEIQNQVFKDQAKEYKTLLDNQQGMFEEFEQAKLDFGEEKAKQLFATQTAGAISYLEYLKQQKAQIEGSVAIGPNPEQDNGQILKIQEITKRIQAEEAKERENAFKKQIADYKALLEAAVSYNEQRAAINKRFDDLEALALSDNTATQEQIDLRLKILRDARVEELQGVDQTALQQSEIYKKLNEDIVGFSNDRIKQEIDNAKKILKAGEIADKQGNILKIPPEIMAQIVEYIKKLEEAADKQRKVLGLNSAQLKEIANLSKSAGSNLGKLGDAVRPFNENLAEALDTLSAMGSISGDVFDSFSSFASGDILGGITSAVSAITSILNLGGKNKEEERRRKEEQRKFLLDIYLGELEINALYRERARQQVLINKLKLDGLRDEMALLNSQKDKVQEDYDTIFERLQGERFKATIRQQVEAGVTPGFGSDWLTLSGKTFEEIEQLFMQGQLSSQAAELFQMLQKIKDEGGDISTLIEQNKLAAQEIFTGTTSDSILDSIVQGFAEGKRATADFADDFEKLMKQSVLNALKYQALEKPLKEFYENFAAAAESDGVLTSAEIAQLQASYNATIEAAGAQFDQLQQITQLNFSNNAAGNQNSLQGAIKGITQQQADLLAGQFAGMRMTAFEQLAVAKSSLNVLNSIANNTSLLIQIEAYLRHFRQVGIQVI